MGRLSKVQLEFLQYHDIPLSRVFDATGMSRYSYSAKMSSLGFWVAYGVTPCGAAGHSLRDRKGHCVQCKPANLTYQRRHDEQGEVYVAESDNSRLIKVGTASNAQARVHQLNVYAYGGPCDWHLLYSSATKRAGKVETLAHNMLKEYSASGVYYKDGGYIDCQELFKCSGEIAVAALQHALKNHSGIVESVSLPGETIDSPPPPEDQSMPTTPSPNQVWLVNHFYLFESLLSLELTVRTHNTLCFNGIYTIGDLLQYSSKELLAIDGFGRKGVHEVESILAGRGYPLGTKLRFPIA